MAHKAGYFIDEATLDNFARAFLSGVAEIAGASGHFGEVDAVAQAPAVSSSGVQRFVASVVASAARPSTPSVGVVRFKATIGVVASAALVSSAAVERFPGALSAAGSRPSTTGTMRQSQMSYPVADISKGSWIPSSGNDLTPMVDDIFADEDGTYISATTGECELALGFVEDWVPGTVKIRVRARVA